MEYIKMDDKYFREQHKILYFVFDFLMGVGIICFFAIILNYV